jgi:Fe-Mn family superoxide dismutase
MKTKILLLFLCFVFGVIVALPSGWSLEDRNKPEKVIDEWIKSDVSGTCPKCYDTFILQPVKPVAADAKITCPSCKYEASRNDFIKEFEGKYKTSIPAARPADSGPMAAKDYSGLIGMKGFSDTALDNHFKLYQGYVKNTNTLLEKLETLSSDKKSDAQSYAEFKRRFGWEMNGALLHELYFENLGGVARIDPESALQKKIVAQFGSFDRWKEDFIATGMMRGIGWAILYYEPRTDRLINAWVDEHNTGNIVSAMPVLVMDVFEHAYMPDYQLGRAKYVDVFFKNIDWKKPETRFNKVQAER